MTVDRLIAQVLGLDDLLTALRARAEVVNLSRVEIARLAGRARGLVENVLAPHPGRPLSLDTAFAISAAVGCNLALVENVEYMEQIARRGQPRNAKRARHSTAVSFHLSKRFLRKIAKKGGLLSRSKMSKRKASALGRKAGKAGAAARWGKVTATPAHTGVTKRAPWRKVKATKPTYVGRPADA